uniref:NADH dehydrogenase subunit 4 n=1 Tax=Andricus mairei TaxID=1100877 RepID=UPI00226CCDB0|nr:NADH dehydrogenase subunit 4 [Andricus mairei]UZI00039.1 NADH dehydrogenase subunit 4 [Andricus mairei]UZN92508.1 NADH dehydrogenase subunit 4 [Andricus mairei]
MMILNMMLMFSMLFFYFINYNLLMLYYQNLFFLMFLLFLLYNNIMFFSLKIYYMMFMDYYSFYLILLTIWIMSLMLMSLIKMNFMKLYIYNFIIMLIMLILTFSSINYFMFYFFFEISMIPTLFLIVGWGGQYERIEASIYMLMYTLFASLPMMIILLKIYNKINILNMILLMNMNLINNLYMYIYLLLAFLVKMPMFFFHLWLPKAHVEAPISGSMILAGIMLKLGGYGLLRMMLIMEELCLIYNYFIISFSLMGALLISLLCLKQIDMKMLVAYSSVVHMGMMMSSLMSMNYWGYIGGLIMMIGHGLCSSGLFCLVNINYERLLSRSMLLNKGMMNIIPSMSLFWFIMCIFNMSSPPSLNLFSEIMMINSLLMWSLFLLLILMMLSFFSVVYTMYFYSSINHGFIYKNLNKFISIFYREYLLIYLHLISLFYLIMIF